ncbi:MAG TPA: tRNA (guanosine(46)-N7)-methyltransferase TrmB [Polyangiales bacterium]
MNKTDSQPEARVEPSPRRYVALAPMPPEGPLDLDRLLPGSGEIEIEIGFGRGQFLIQRAQAAPGSRILGIEVKRKWSYLVEQRLIRLGLSQVRVFGTDARELLPRLGPAGSVARVFMHFPDPWWKKRHEKRRLRGPQTFDPVARLLRPGGELFIQTDVEDRAAVFVEDLRAHGGFELPTGDYVEHNPYGAQSNRETRAIADGLPVFRMLARKRVDAGS